jgi:hypothetical protein
MLRAEERRARQGAVISVMDAHRVHAGDVLYVKIIVSRATEWDNERGRLDDGR